MNILDVYADESCKSGHRYLSIGAIAVEKKGVPSVLARFHAARASRNAWAEVKWSAFRRSKFHFYKMFADTFFDLAHEDTLHFHSLYVDTQTADAGTFDEWHGDFGFDKLIYQLLLHKIGKRYGEHYRIHVYLDARECRQAPNVLRPMLNNTLAKWHKIDTEPFRDIRFMDSKASDILQAADLLTSCIGSRKNGHHKRVGACQEKRELGDHIARRAKALDWPFGLESRFAKRFTIWPFVYKKGS
jgi:hypothetical protein